jgi:hypothetical protein
MTRPHKNSLSHSTSLTVLVPMTFYHPPCSPEKKIEKEEEENEKSCSNSAKKNILYANEYVSEKHKASRGGGRKSGCA